MAVSTVLPSKSLHRPGGRSGRELHRGARARREAWPWAMAAGPGLDGLTRSRWSRWSRRQGRPWACRGARSSRRQGLEARRASIFGRSEHDDAQLVEVNIDSSKVCLSCQTHSVAAGNLDVSMVSTVLEVHHRDVVVGLEVEPSLENVSVPTNGDHRESSRKQCQGVYRHKGGDFPAGRISTRKLVQHGHEREPRRPWAWR